MCLKETDPYRVTLLGETHSDWPKIWLVQREKTLGKLEGLLADAREAFVRVKRHGLGQSKRESTRE